jgi:transposase
MLPSALLTDDEFRIIHDHYAKSDYSGIRLRSHCALLSHKGYSPVQIADILFESEQTICRWINGFEAQRIASLFPKYLDNEHASKLTRQQKIHLKKVLSQKPSEYGIPAGFWDISVLRQYVKAEFGVEYESDESYRLIFLLHNYSFHLPDTFDRHRDENKVSERVKEIKHEIKPLLKDPSQLRTF